MGTYRNTKTPGVKYKEHAERKHGRQLDRYFVIYYQLNKKQKLEAIGWASQGWTESKAAAILNQIKENIRLGKHPQTLAEMREMDEKAKKEEEQIAIENEAESITLREVFDRYIESHKIETTERTWQRTQNCYLFWVDKLLGSKKLSEVTVDEIQDLVNVVVKTRAPRTADYVKTVIRQIINFAKKRDLYSKDNPAMKVKIKLKDNKRSRFLTKEEARILLNELNKRSTNVHDMALLSLYSGLRAGEICNLTWENVMWDTERLFVGKTKNGQARFEPMHPLVKEMLKRRQSVDSMGYIFKAQNGEQLKEVSDTFQRTVDKLGFNDGITDPRLKIVFHSLRHTYASWLVMNGVDLYTTQKLMGHKSNQMTQRYAHLAPGHLEKAVNSLESI